MQRSATGLTILATLVIMTSPVAAVSDEVQWIEVEGTKFQIILSNGRTVPQDQLPGTILAIGDGTGWQRRIRIDGVERNPKDPAGEVMLHALSEQVQRRGMAQSVSARSRWPTAWVSACRAFTAKGRYEAAPGRILLTCTGGAEGKCVRFGYKPWGFGPNNVSLAPYYQACVRLVRADYCGDGLAIHAMARRSTYLIRSTFKATRAPPE